MDKLLVLRLDKEAFEDAVEPWLRIARHLRFVWSTSDDCYLSIYPATTRERRAQTARKPQQSDSARQASAPPAPLHPWRLLPKRRVGLTSTTNDLGDICKDRNIEVVFEDLNEDSDSLVSHAYWKKRIKEIEAGEECEQAT
ncbi:hypothetical protein JCM8547_002678 [Rhodosporidiobolus lusitaniae]